MKKLVKIIVLLIVVIGLALTGLIGFVKTSLPDVPLKEGLTIESTPERIERGEYLANHVSLCMDCHGTRDWSKFSGPMVPGTKGFGGEKFSREFGFPGEYYSPNITPHGVGDWTDAELYRAITAGVNKTGDALFPVMPYPYFGQLADEDIYSIIAYIKTLPSLESLHPSSTSDFPMSVIINTIPGEQEKLPLPSDKSSAEYGKYVATAAGCAECHTRVEKGQVIPELMFSGGRDFTLPWGVIYSANITPDPENGIGNWSKEKFIQRFKFYDPTNGYVPHEVNGSDMNTIMPWTMYAGMTEEDLGAIYTYLMSVKPIPYEVPR